MYFGGISYTISKSFGRLQLVPESFGLRFVYTPVINGEFKPNGEGFINVVVPLEAIGRVWTTAKAFLYEFESLDENIIVSRNSQDSNSEASEILLKLYRDKPKGDNGTLNGKENTWLRIVTGRSEQQRRRIKLGAKDLLSIDLACSTTVQLATNILINRPLNSKDSKNLSVVNHRANTA